MKSYLNKLPPSLCGLFFTTAVFGQTTHIWTNNYSPTDISASTHWINSATGGHGMPDSSTGEILGFHGQPTGTEVTASTPPAQPTHAQTPHFLSNPITN